MGNVLLAGTVLKWLALVLILTLSACTSQKREKTLVYCSEGSPSTFNPQLATDGPSFNASSRVIYNRLVDFSPGDTDLIPSLAESWEISKEGRHYTFKLRPGVQFHSRGDFTPTRNFNAEDVLFSFNRQRDKEHPYHSVNNAGYEYFNSMAMGELIQNIVAVDERTVRFELSRPEAPFLANLAMDFASILSAEYAEHLAQREAKEKIDWEPIGTGPYVFRSYVKDNLIRYQAHPEYFEGPAKVSRLVFSITPEPSVRYQKLRAGECHLVAEPSPSDLVSMRTDSRVQVLSQPGLNVGYVAMNVEKPPFDQLKVRQAIHHALNRASYIEAIYMGQAQVAKNPIPPTLWSYNDQVKDYDYNPERARELLREAGFPDGFQAEMWTLPVSRPYNPDGRKMGELIQADLAQVGIRLRLVTFDWPTYLAKARQGEHQLLQLGWTGDNGDPDNFLNVLLGCRGVVAGSNVARWCHQEFEDLISRARTLSDQGEREKLYRQAQKIFKREAPWVTLAHSVVFRALSPEIEGYQISPFGTESFHRIGFK